ncbi:hypothetical protein [Marivirga sp.]|uniref:hypothetical protein n=1 Tax=Marivirga sp. TaxID=2018662 RepID=UPI003DA79B60
MKTIFNYSLILSAFFILASCNQNSENAEFLIGKWKMTPIEKDTSTMTITSLPEINYDFKSDGSFVSSSASGGKNLTESNWKIEGDTLMLGYGLIDNPDNDRFYNKNDTILIYKGTIMGKEIMMTPIK